MASAKSIISKIDRTLRRFNLTDRTIYKRTTTRTGGDDLIGRPGSVVYTDVLMDPQPAYQRLTRNIVGNNAPAQKVISSSGDSNQIGADYSVLLTPSHMTKLELESPDVSLVFKDIYGNTETYSITDYEVQPFQGQDVMTIAYLRSIQRASVNT